MENNEIKTNEEIVETENVTIEPHSGKNLGLIGLGVLAVGTGVVLGVKKLTL